MSCKWKLIGATSGYWDVVVATGAAGSAFSVLTDGYEIEIMAPKADLSGARAYPMPYNPKMGGMMTFDNLTPGAAVKIFTIAGTLVRSVDDSAGSGKAFWDGTNDAGATVASGIYIVLTKDSSGLKRFKIAVEK